MTSPSTWATLQDFATLFLYFWHRDFPLGPETATGASRSDWTIHIGIAVRNIATLMGLVTRFERGRRKDAVLRGSAGDEIALEWEWQDVWGNELEKLKNHKTWSWEKGTERLIRYCVFISYSHTDNLSKSYEHVAETWKGAHYPLLLILVEWIDSKKYSSRRDFKRLHMCSFNSDGRTDLRIAPATPWDAEPTAGWFRQLD